jgi:hypothetical protein
MSYLLSVQILNQQLKSLHGEKNKKLRDD